MCEAGAPPITFSCSNGNESCGDAAVVGYSFTDKGGGLADSKDNDCDGMTDED